MFEEYTKMICPYCTHFGDEKYTECNVVCCIDKTIKCCQYSKDKNKFSDNHIDEYTCKVISNVEY